LKAKLKVTAHKFTATAKAAIEAAGGEAVTIM
jgi:large subunit ribosomal protein L15